MRTLSSPDLTAVSAEPPTTGPWWLQPAMLFDGERLRANMALRIDEGWITAMRPADEPRADAAPYLQSDCIACPAFVDLQVNGGGGRLFNNEPTPEALTAIATAHRQGGTRAWMPTLLTSPPAVMEQAVETVIAVYGRHGVAGMHIEGPHISPDFRGAHALEYIRPPMTIPGAFCAACAPATFP